jgi:hypothetical protein
MRDYQPGPQRERELRAQVADLETELRLKTTDPLSGLPGNLAALGDRFIRTLHTLNEAADPRSSRSLEAQRSYKRPDSTTDEGAPTRWARALLRRIDNKLTPLLSEADARISGTYQPPPQQEKVRCVNTDCDRYGRRIPRWIGPKNEIEIMYCDGKARGGGRCGNKLARA